MARTALCPILVQRDDQLAILEDALMAAQRGDDEAHRRVQGWLEEHGVPTQREELELKGFEGAQVAYRIAAPVREPAAGRRTA
jgi:hypothetical protein